MSHSKLLFKIYDEVCPNTKGGRRWHAVVFPQGKPSEATATNLRPTAELAIQDAIGLGASPDVSLSR